MVKLIQATLHIPSLLIGESITLPKEYLNFFRIAIFVCHFIFMLGTFFVLGFINSMKFLTFWAFYLCVAYFGIMVYNIRNTVSKRVMNFAVICFEISFAFEFVVTVLYWVWVYPHTKEEVLKNPGEFEFSLYVHGFVLLTLYLDYAFSTVIININNFKYLLSAIFAYIISNAFWTLCIERVYPIITYKDAKTYIYFIIAFIAISCHFYIGHKIGALLKTQKIDEIRRQIDFNSNKKFL